MSGEHDKLVNKDICEKEHKNLEDKLTDLRANIHTSKESLGNRLDTVHSELNKALLGSISSPGGLMRDVANLKDNAEKQKKSKDEYEKRLNEKINSQNTKIKICLILFSLILGGKFLGFSVKAVFDYIKPIKEPTPIVKPVELEEENKEVPQAVKDYIKQQLEKENK